MEKTQKTEEIRLRKAGFFSTPRRIRMLEIFRERAMAQNELPKHLTAEDLYEILNAEGLSASLGTIYRALGAFAEKGILRQLITDRSRASYEWADRDHHDHLICTGCRKVLEFRDEVLEASQRRIAQTYGFELTDHVTVLYGKCAECAKK